MYSRTNDRLQILFRLKKQPAQRAMDTYSLSCTDEFSSRMKSSVHSHDAVITSKEIALEFRLILMIICRHGIRVAPPGNEKAGWCTPA